jgi:F-type H+-transporting ATPase subunit a
MSKENPFAADHLLGHVKDADHFVVPRALTKDGSGIVKLPQPLELEHPIQPRTGFAPVDKMIEPLDFKFTKFMALELVASVIICVLFIRLAQKISSGRPPKGRLWQMLEAMVIYVRDEMARPAIGHHDGDKFFPFVATIFFFVLICNLLGMLPWLGSATGALGTTLALALLTFATVIGSAVVKLGPAGFLKSIVPPMDMPLPMKIFLVPMIFVIEVAGLCIKHLILGVRLLANMLAGHLVLTVIVTFISAAWLSVALYAVAPASILGAVALSLLELLVAVLQAYLFAFLAALFIGMAVHPH